MPEGFEVYAITAYVLVRDGKPVVDEYGNPKLFLTRAEAEHVAAHWDRYRAPTYAELKAMSDEELMRRADG